MEQFANPVVARSGLITELRPGRDEVAAIRRILVGVDGSAAAALALERAGRLAERVGAEILVGNVFEPDQAEVSPDDYERLIAEAEHSLNAEWAEPLRGSRVQHRGLQLIGAPDSLLAATEAEGVVLLVVGTRGTGHLAGLHIGSMAQYLAHHTRAPLAIVPAAGATATIDRIVVGVDGSLGGESAVNWCAAVAAACSAEVPRSRARRDQWRTFRARSAREIAVSMRSSTAVFTVLF